MTGLANTRVRLVGSQGGVRRPAIRFRLPLRHLLPTTEPRPTQALPIPSRNPRGGPRDSPGWCFHRAGQCTP